MSVILPAYNAATTVGRAVEDILTQTFSDLELIVIDDCSTDETSELLDRVDDPRVRIHRNEVNLGIVRALNLGLGVARGEFVARMDADDRTHPDRLRLQVAEFRRQPTLGLLAAQSDVFDRTNDRLNPYKAPESNARLQSALLGYNWFVHGSVMFRMACVHAVGGYRAQYDLAEDLDLWLRISELWRVSCLSDVLYTYSRYPESISYSREDEVRAAERDAIEAAMARRTGHADGSGLRWDVVAAVNNLGALGVVENVFRWVRRLLHDRHPARATQVAAFATRGLAAWVTRRHRVKEGA